MEKRNYRQIDSSKIELYKEIIQTLDDYNEGKVPKSEISKYGKEDISNASLWSMSEMEKRYPDSIMNKQNHKAS